MEAARRVDEWDRLRTQISNFKEILVVDSATRDAIAGGQMEVDEIEERVISLIDGVREIEDLIQDSHLFRYEVLSALAGFLQSSMVRPSTLTCTRK